MPDEKGRVTEEEANEALVQLVQQAAENPDGDSAVTEPSQAAEPETPAEATEEPAAEAIEATEAEAAPAEATPAEPETDDVESLKRRLEAIEATSAEQATRFEARMKAFHDRASQNERILHDRFLRKSTAADKALKVLRATRSETGVPEAEVDAMIREIEGTMNPQSASYSPPPAPVAEDQAIVLNNFLNEKGMTGDEAGSFGQWIQTQGPTKLSIMEQAVATQSMDGFLRIAHQRWQDSIREEQSRAAQVTRNDTVEAVKAVQRTQKEAARAASSAPTAPKKQPAKPTSSQKKSWKDFSQEEIAKLIQESVEQYH